MDQGKKKKPQNPFMVYETHACAQNFKINYINI